MSEDLDVFNGNLSETEEEERRHRLHNNKKSKAAKLAWKRHHASYMRGTRERERRQMNQTFYGISKDLESCLTEATTKTDNVFEQSLRVDFEHITGGIAFTVDKKENTISISTTLGENGAGRYGVTSQQDLESLYKQIKDDILNLCNTIDDEIVQIMTKHGLKSTQNK